MWLPQESHCGKGRHKMSTHTLPVYLLQLLDQFAVKFKVKKSEVVAKGICRVIGVNWDLVKEKNAELYPALEEEVLAE